MLMTDDAARQLAGRADVFLRFGGSMISRDDLAAIVADWTEARAVLAHVIALHRQAREELQAIEDAHDRGHVYTLPTLRGQADGLRDHRRRHRRHLHRRLRDPRLPGLAAGAGPVSRASRAAAVIRAAVPAWALVLRQAWTVARATVLALRVALTRPEPDEEVPS
jgi:hypothetical protein